jgi:hypothetical protein
VVSSPSISDYILAVALALLTWLKLNHFVVTFTPSELFDWTKVVLHMSIWRFNFRDVVIHVR